MIQRKQTIYLFFCIICFIICAVAPLGVIQPNGIGEFLPADMKILDEHTALVEICEGKFHQVKKMFNAVGANVTYLKRLRIGTLFLDETLEKGGFRELSESEIRDILCTKHGIYTHDLKH